MNCDDHLPPHIHAEYAEHVALFDFSGEIIKGKFPPKQAKLVGAWTVMHEDELVADWALAEKNGDLLDIIPLKRGD
jgi:hypothetical protein